MATSLKQPNKSAAVAGAIVEDDCLPSDALPETTAVLGKDSSNLVVGIGASAGGLDAFRAFFSHMPPDSGIAFVLVQHLDPQHESSLVAIIAVSTTMPVLTAQDGAAIRPDHVYIIPPDAILTVADGMLHLARPAPPAARRTSIDAFLTSLAQDQGECAVGIILSGFGSDGARGMAAIKTHGGLTLSQAAFDHQAKSGMPHNATSGGMVDLVLAVEEMPAALLRHRHHRVVAAPAASGTEEDSSEHLAAVCDVLRSRLGRDFSRYKTGILMRRIHRRMNAVQAADMPAYVALLNSRADEAELLFRELLIGVTRFFRDRGAFDALQAAILPGLLDSPVGSEPIRVWVAGCATGEEAYSVAILLLEGFARAGRRRPVQIFATDVDDRAVAVARAGIYPAASTAGLSADQLDRYFVREDGHFRISKDVREMCLFSVHDLSRDPPFSRIDLVCCRNLLIYFESDLQLQVLTTLHFALRPGGHLFLGPSETVSAQSRLFAPVDKRHRLFTRLDTKARYPVSARLSAGEGPASARDAIPPVADSIERRAARAMAPYSPAFLVIDSQHTVLRFSGATALYLQPAAGTASLNLFRLLHPDLRAPALAALRQAAQNEASVRLDNITLHRGPR